METSKGNILLVEDNIILQESLGSLFIENGYKVKAVKNGYQAVDSVRKEAFDLAVINKQLSAMSSLTTMQAMQIIDPAVAVVITSVPYDEDPEVLINQGVDACTSTLFSSTQIIATIEEVLRAKGIRGPEKDRQRRIFKRRGLNVPICYSQNHPSGIPSETRKSFTGNISAGGLLFESNEPISPFASMNITIELSPSPKKEPPSTINSLADVMWVTKMRETGKYKIGTRFTETQGITERELLDKLLEI